MINSSKVIVLLLFLFVSCQFKRTEYGGYNYEVKVVEYHVNIFGELHGFFEEYSEEGVLRKKGRYKRNKLDGDYYEYHHNGNLKIHVYYNDDLLWNVIEYYDDAGNTLDYGGFQDGNGHLKIYCPDGNLRSEGLYLNGLIHGEWKLYSNAGYSHSIFFESGKQSGENKYQNRPPNL